MALILTYFIELGTQRILQGHCEPPTGGEAIYHFA
jgi:hypothetical protein